MKFVALKELPQGTQPGEVFDVNEDIGNVFILVGAARKATRADASSEPVPARTAEPEDTSHRPSSRRYQRRDLQAEE